MLHLLYIIAFTIVAFLAIGNLIRSVFLLGFEAQRGPSRSRRPRSHSVPHPEFLDDSGNVIQEPLLVMRSMTVEDAREQLDALYNLSPGSQSSNEIRNNDSDL
ncbi:MAG: DUF2973 domain-containing protein [Leptolyngbyaceae cyanobacterium bins.59]|nr:DUF2973 domain-containing protein [Leptolyngbyaceae cyanobacterium bins.59]